VRGPVDHGLIGCHHRANALTAWCDRARDCLGDRGAAVDALLRPFLATRLIAVAEPERPTNIAGGYGYGAGEERGAGRWWRDPGTVALLGHRAGLAMGVLWLWLFGLEGGAQ
jgi:hypothetical protein